MSFHKGLCWCIFLHFCLVGASESTKTQDDGLSPAVLRHILFIEPNLHLQQLGNVSDISGRLKRTFLDTGHRRAANVIQRWMSAAGMATWTDPVANVHGRAHSARPGAPAMLVGSHYDTVIDGGRFDGALGIISGIAAVKALVLEAAVRTGTLTNEQLDEAVEALQTSGKDGVPGILDVDKLLMQHLRYVGRPLLRRPVEVVAFSDEEGIRFQSTFLGSNALVGTLASSGVLDIKDSAGLSLLDALRAKGLADNLADVEAAALVPGSVAGYVEVHLEQGPVLESNGRPLGVVDGIAGQMRLLISFTGEQGHAGTVPMWMRRDPLAGISELMVEIEKICSVVSGAGVLDPKSSKSSDDDEVWASLRPGSDRSLVCTVGNMGIWPGASNVIPGATNITLDVRSQSDASKKDVISAVHIKMDRICKRRGLRCKSEVRHKVSAVKCDAKMTDALAKAVNESSALIESISRDLPGGSLMSHGNELSFLDSKPPGAVSLDSSEKRGDQKISTGGGCDAENIGYCPADGAVNDDAVIKLTSGAGHDAMSMASITPMGMLFVRCAGGISHSPSEWVMPQDVAAGTAALLQFLRDWQTKDENS